MKYSEKILEKVANVATTDATNAFIKKTVQKFGAVEISNLYVNNFGRYFVQIGESKFISDFDRYTNQKIAELSAHKKPLYFKNI
jgi:hypothetical protein